MGRRKSKAQKADPKNVGGRPRVDPDVPTPFSEWLKTKAGKAAPLKEVAEELGLSLSSIYNLKNGGFRPSLDLALRLEEYTDGAITVQAWAE